MVAVGLLDELGEKVFVCGERSGIQVIIVSSQDLDGHPESEVGLAQAVGVESSLAVGLGGQAVEVSEDHAAHRACEEITDLIGLASIDGRCWTTETSEVVVSNGVDVESVAMDCGEVKGDLVIVNELNKGNCTVERVCSRFWM